MSGAHPYAGLPEAAFWRPAVGERPASEITGLWQPKFRVTRADRIITAGSCFAQHIGRALAARGYRWFDAEPAPDLLPAGERAAFHYGTFSFRTGNIYTPRMLAQWLSWAFGTAAPPEDDLWREDGRWFDPFRPGVEPGGFDSAAELLASRAATLAAIRRAVHEGDIFVFTLGLTEAWEHAGSGVEYALCPGTVAGRFKPRFHRFVNHGYGATLAAMRAALAQLRAENPGLRVLLTVSPVPLTATASGEHVLTATTYSKSVLRAVAGELAATEAGVDYFPSYEIITAPPFGGRFYAANCRSVTAEGVDFVMRSFFRDQEAAFGAEPAAASAPVAVPEPGEDDCEDDREEAEEARLAAGAADLRCEEEMLDAFRR